MLAGGMTIAAPSMMVPEAQAAGALYVSAENAMFDNTFGGAQIIEVIVIGHASRTDITQGEPVVKVDDNQLRMAQAVDGNWYGYFGDSTKVPAANAAANNLTFGDEVTPTVVDGDFNEAASVFSSTGGYVSGNSSKTVQTDGVLTNYPVLSAWNGTLNTGNKQFSATAPANGTVGQIGIPDVNAWPIIQLYDLTIENFDVVYEQAGADEVVSLNYDSGDLDDYASLTLDRSGASQGSEIHLVITDNQLNIDPTAEDVVIFYTHSDGRGAAGEGVSFTNATLGTLMKERADYKAFDNTFDDNGKLLINNQTNGESILVETETLDDAIVDGYLVFFEGGENSGIFYNTDDDDDSNLNVDDYAKRGFTATFDYNDSAQSFVVANDFGTIEMDGASVGDVWNSGEALTVTLIDQDLNKNSGSSEDLTIVNTTRTHLIPSLQIGNPLMISQNLTDDGGTAGTIVSVSNYSNIAYWTDLAPAKTTGATNNYTVVPSYSGADIIGLSTAGNTYFNWDMGAFGNSTNAVNGVCLYAADGDSHACGTTAKGITEVTGALLNADVYIGVRTAGNLGNQLTDIVGIPIIGDIFSFGAGENNAIYRILLEETDDNTATFTGSIEYTMLNQVNMNLDSTYTDLSTVDQDIDIIIEQDMTDEDSPRVNYLDLGADGISTQIADQYEAPTHNGVVSFDLDNYKIGDTVVVTLDDQDMNADSELIDVYTVHSTTDKVGSGTDATLVLDITFDDMNWNNSGDDNDCTTADISGSDGFYATGFTLTETGAETGIFQGSFQVPTNFCWTDDDGANTDTDSVRTVTGTDTEVN
jgi:hypothetical protein